MKINAKGVLLLVGFLLSACAADVPLQTARACMPSEVVASQAAVQVSRYMRAAIRTDGIMDESFLVGQRFLVDRQATECKSGTSLVMQLPRALTPRNEEYLKALFDDGVAEFLP